MIQKRCILAASLLFFFLCCKTNNKPNQNKNVNPLVIRTDFTDDHGWEILSHEIKKPDKELGFKAHVSFVNEGKNKNKSSDKLTQELVKNDYSYDFYFIVDSFTVQHPEKPILCISTNSKDTLDKFRVIPSEMWIIENNLSTANLLFEEFLYSVDRAGIHRTKETDK